ncbi:MAG: glucuronate isomerase [Kiritimatiellia bacterium]
MPTTTTFSPASPAASRNGGIPGRVQHGAAWWFLDQKDGIETQLEVLSQLGLLSRFAGMLTDSRSFLSFSSTRVFPPHPLQPGRPRPGRGPSAG